MRSAEDTHSFRKMAQGLTLSSEGFPEEETPAENPELWTSFHVLRIREHTLVTGSREEVGLSRAGGTCGALLSISTTTTTTTQVQAAITSHPDNCQRLPAVFPASTLAPLQPILHTKIRIQIRVGRVIPVTPGFPLLLN